MRTVRLCLTVGAGRSNVTYVWVRSLRVCVCDLQGKGQAYTPVERVSHPDRVAAVRGPCFGKCVLLSIKLPVVGRERRREKRERGKRRQGIRLTGVWHCEV